MILQKTKKIFFFKVLYLENIFKWDAFCLIKFEFTYPKINLNYNYNLTLLNKYPNSTLSTSLFSINSTLDCLTFELLKGISIKRNQIIGKHTLRITAYDNCHRFDNHLVNIFIIDSCEYKILLTVNFDSRHVYQNKNNYLIFLSEISTAILSKNIEAIIYKIYDGNEEIDNFFSITTK